MSTNQNLHLSRHINIIQVIFLFIITLSACHAPDQERLREIGITPSQINSGPKESTDPLFFIEGQLCQHLRKIYQDHRGHLWFGTNVYDLMRYDGDTLVVFSERDGVGAGRITSITEDRDGQVWFGSYQGLTRFDGQSFSRFPAEEGTAPLDVWSVLIDRKQNFWIGTIDGVLRFDGQDFTPFPLPKAQVEDTTSILSYDRVTSILEDRNGTLWFGTDGFGICQFDGRSFSHLTMQNGLCDNNITSLLEDQQGNIWIGTMFGGISRYNGQTFTHFTREGQVKGEEVYSIYEDAKGNIWFPAEGHGVYRYDGTSFTNFHTQNGLVTDGIQCIYEDREGRLWLGGWGGLFRYDGQSFFSVTKEGPWK